MIVASIRKEKDNYYVNLDQKDDKFYYYVVYTSNESISVLNKSQTISLFKDLVESKMVFKEKENDYDIYLDEAGNRRYFKNGNEDYLKLFMNNGKPTTMYDEIEQKVIEAKKKFEFVRILFTRGVAVTEAVASAFLTAVLIEAIMHPGTKISDNFIIDIGKFSNIVKGNLTVDEMTDYIMDTNGDNFDKKSKKYLANEDLFNDVLDYADPSRYYILRKKMKNINIRYFDETDKDRINQGVVGYYDFNNINTINIADDSEHVFDYATGHEFIHLLQDNNKYYYIREACAEIMKWEYFDEPISAYRDQINRTYKLMEIIGPDPVMECNFKGDTSNFENTIISNLGEEDGKRLLELLTVSPCFGEDKIESTNEEIDELLAKMYNNVYGKDINDDKLFKKYLDSNVQYGARIYFNKNNEFYNEPLEVYYTKEIVLNDEELNSDDYTFTCCYKEDIDEKTYEELKDKLGEIVSKTYYCIDGYTYSRKDNNFISEDGKKVYNELEAKEKNLYTKVDYTRTRYEKYNSYKAMEENPEKYVYCTVSYKDSDIRLGMLRKDKDNNIVVISDSCMELIEPISEKFGKQSAKETNGKNTIKG